MKIIIAGCGEVGSHLAKLLSREEQDITVIDEDSSKLAVLDSNYNLLTVQGRPTSFKTLRQAGVEGCDLFIAVTPFETRNIVSCAIAKSLGAEKTVARVDNFEFKDPANRPFFASIGADDMIYPEYLAALEIITALNHNWARHWFELHEGELILVGVKLRDNAPLIGKYLKDLGRSTHDFHVAAIKRHHETIIPGGDDRLLADDIVYFMTTREHVANLIPPAVRLSDAYAMSSSWGQPHSHTALQHGRRQVQLQDSRPRPRAVSQALRAVCRRAYHQCRRA